MKILISSLLILTSLSAFSQGTILFMNRIQMLGLDAPISYAAGGPVPAGLIDGATTVSAGGYVWGGVNAMAGLYAGPVGSTEDELVLLAPALGFRTGVVAGYLTVDGAPVSREIPGIPQGSTAIFQVRAWDAGVPGVASYEDAQAISQSRYVYLGKSGVISVSGLGGLPPYGPPILPPCLSGLQGFSMTGSSSDVLTPEPTTIALGVLGSVLGVGFLRRHKES